MGEMNIEAAIDEIEESAKQVKLASDEVEVLKPSTALDDIGDAMSASESSSAAAALSKVWTNRFATWASDADKHGDARAQSAENYTQADFEAYQKFQKMQEPWRRFQENGLFGTPADGN